MAEEYQRETTALDTVVPLSPTAGALTDILSKAAGARTFNKATDSFEAIADAIDALSLLSDKEKAFIGITGQPFLKDHFLTTNDHADPSTDNWTVVEDTGASVNTEGGTSLSYMVISSGSTATNDGVAHTAGKKQWDSVKETKTVNVRCKFKVVDLTGEFCLGLYVTNMDAYPPTADVYDATYRAVAGLHGDNDVIDAVTQAGNNVAAEITDISASLADNTWYELEITETSTSVIFKINGATVATHSTQVAAKPQCFVACTKNTNGINTYLNIQYAEVWVT